MVNTSEKSVNKYKNILQGIKGIIFDFDGTLFDNALFAVRLIFTYLPDIFRIWKERIVRTRFSGCDYSTPQVYYNAFFNEFGKACHCSPERIKDWYFNRYMPRMAKVLKKYYKPRPGAKEMLEYFDSPGSPIHAAIYSDYPFLKERMEAVGFSAFKDIPLCGPDTFGAQKPAGRPFLEIAKTFGVMPHDVLVVGDREETDGFGALQAGMHFFKLETGRRRNYLVDPPAKKQHIPKQFVLNNYSGKWDVFLNSFKI